MKIVLVHNYYPVIGGGEDSVFAEERRLLEDNGHTIIPFTCQIKERNIFDFIYAATCLIWNPVSYTRMRRLIQKESPDIVHCHNTFPVISPSVYWACKREKVPVVQTLHNYRLACPNALFLRDNKPCELCSGKMFPYPSVRYRCYRNSLAGSFLISCMLWFHRKIGTFEKGVTQYITLTDFAKSRFVESGLISADKIDVKPNFVSDPQIESLADQNPERIEERGSSVLFLGRLSPEKGCEVVVDAWGMVKDRLGYKLLILGDGPERKRLETQAGGDESVVFLGAKPRDDVFGFFNDAAFMVLPSICYEAGLPMTIIEAFACRVPVVSSKIGGMSTIIKEFETGLFFKSGDSSQLAEKIEWAIKNKEKMAEMGQNGRHEYENKYTREKNLSQLVEIYKKIK